MGEERGPDELERDAKEEPRAHDVGDELHEGPRRDARAREPPELLDALVRAERRTDPIGELREVVPADPRAGLVEPLRA